MHARASAAALVVLGVLVAACGGGTGAPAASVSGMQPRLTVEQRRVLAERYLAIATPANAQLDAAVDGFREHQRKDLSAAAADLREQASVERRFDRELLAIGFPVQIKMVVTKLVQANDARADLAGKAAMSPSLLALASFAPAQSASDARVEQQVKIIRMQLGLPPPDQG